MWQTINPKPVKRYRNKWFSYLAWVDIVIVGIAAVLAILAFVYSSGWVMKLVWFLIIALVTMIVTMPVPGANDTKLWNLTFRWMVYLTSRKKYIKKQSQMLVPYKAIEDGIVKLKTGSYIQILRINGFNYQTLTEHEAHSVLENYRSFLRNMDINFTISALDVEVPLDENKAYLDKLFKATKSKEKEKVINVSKDILNSLEETSSNVERQYFIFLYGTKSKLENITDKVISWLTSSSLTTERLSDKEISGVLGSFYGNPKNENIKDLISSDISFGSNYIQYGDKYQRIYAIDEYPSQVSEGWLFPISQIPNVSFVMNVESYSTTKASKKLDKIIRNIEVNQLSVRKHSEGSKANKEYDLMSELSHQIHQDSESINSTYSFLIASANSRKELNEIHKTIMSKAVATSFKVVQLKYLQFNALSSILPKANMDLRKLTSIEVPSTSLAMGFPYHQDFLADHEGIYLGYSQMGSNIFFNQWKLDEQRKNHNMTILGNSGGGKSTLLKKLVKDNWIQGTKIFMIDGQRENKKLCDNLNGKWLNMGADKDKGEENLIMNPLQFFREDESSTGNISTHMQFLESFFKSLFPQMNDVQSSELQSIVSKLYNKKLGSKMKSSSELKPSNYPILRDLSILIDKELDLVKKSKTENHRTTNMYTLSTYFKCFQNPLSPESIMWNGYTNFNTDDSQLYVFDISSIISSQNMRLGNAQMTLLLKFIFAEVIKNRVQNLANEKVHQQKVFIVVDEAHLIINEKAPAGVEFLFMMVKTIRKYSGSVLVTTQNVSDLMGGSKAMLQKTSAILNNAQYAFTFQMNPDDLTKLVGMNESSSFILSKEEKDYISSAGKGSCLFTLSQRDRKMIQIDVSRDELDIWKDKNEA